MIKILPTDCAFPDSIDVGPDCICSRCGKVIDVDEVPIRVWVCVEKPDGAEYRYHPACLGMVIVTDECSSKPIELGLVLEGNDAREFWEDRKNPKVTKEQILMFKEAKRIYNTQFRDM